MNARLQAISKTRKTWKNSPHNVTFTPLRYFIPHSKDDIALIVQEAEQDGYRVRAVGSGHSFSDVTVCRDFLIDMRRLGGWEKVDPDTVKSAHRDQHLVRVGAGMRLKHLNKALDRAGLALPNMGTINVQTISGALGTCTHGTGIRRPAFPDMIRSIGLVSSGGKFLRIEPAGGISDAGKVPADVTLIQDDDTFYSTVVSFGGMGIMYELVLEVVPAFWIREYREVQDWAQVRAALLDGSFLPDIVRQFDYVSLRVNPYPVKGDHLATVVRQQICPAKPARSLNARFKNLASAIMSRIPFLPWFFTRFINLVPRYTPRAINGLLMGTRDKEFVGKSFRVLFQSAINLRRYGISTEFSFPIDGKQIAGQIDEIIRKADENRKNGNLYLSSFISVRFTPASLAYLSTAYGRETFYIEVPLLQKTVGDYELLARFQKQFLTAGGRPHWGKVNDQAYDDPQVFRNEYPRLDTWREVKQKLDPQGTFTNDFITKTVMNKNT